MVFNLIFLLILLPPLLLGNVSDLDLDADFELMTLSPPILNWVDHFDKDVVEAGD